MRASLAAAVPMLGLVLGACAQTAPDPEDVLTQAQGLVLDRAESVPNYTCVQTVDRTFLKRLKPESPLPSCDRIRADHDRRANRMRVEATDRLRLDVKVSGGDEIGSWVGAGHFQKGDVLQFVKGPFGTGPFSAFLTDIFSVAGVRFDFAGEESVDNAKLFRYRFQVSQESSHYRVRAGKDERVTGYDGDVWIDLQSFKVKRLRVRTLELPEETGACEATTTVDYASTPVGAGDFLLPRHSELHFLMRDTTESRIASGYTSCREFLGDARLVDEPAATPAAAPSVAGAAISIPPGLLVTLTLAASVDTSSAAAGDPVEAEVSQDVRDKASGEVVIPAGSRVRGRLTAVEH